ncbi:MAG: hypothetical protein WCJ09_18575, partial [Planctomycetota bacterium]
MYLLCGGYGHGFRLARGATMTVGFETLVQIHSVAPLFYPADIVVTVHTPNSRIDLRALRG